MMLGWDSSSERTASSRGEGGRLPCLPVPVVPFGPAVSAATLSSSRCSMTCSRSAELGAEVVQWGLQADSEAMWSFLGAPLYDLQDTSLKGAAPGWGPGPACRRCHSRLWQSTGCLEPVLVLY